MWDYLFIQTQISHAILSLNSLVLDVNILTKPVQFDNRKADIWLPHSLKALRLRWIISVISKETYAYFISWEVVNWVRLKDEGDQLWSIERPQHNG